MLNIIVPLHIATMINYCNLNGLILLLFLSVFITLLVRSVVKPKMYPPGPAWLPFIGCYLQFQSLYSKKKYFHLVWSHLHEIYGPIVGQKLGCDKIVTVSDYEAVKEVLSRDDFEDRPDGFFFRLRALGDRLGIVFVEGPLMHGMRKFCIQQLRNFGFANGYLQEIITQEALGLVDYITFKQKKGCIHIQYMFDVATLNAFWTIIAGQRFCLEDQKLKKLMDLMHSAFRLVDMSGGLLNKMPFLRFIFPSMMSTYKSLILIVEEINDFLKDVIRKHEEQQSSDDFISAFLEEIRKSGNSKNTIFHKKQLLVLLQDLLMAGIETTNSTLVFALHYLVKYPEVQNKIHLELDGIVGAEQIPSMNHQLTYLEATIMEIQRHANPVPVAIPHIASKKTQLMGYTIPKGTFILPSLWSIHMNEKYWEQPYKFDPERFIDENNKLRKSPYFIPFGLGRRKCIGEQLAKTNMLLFLSIILQKFKIEATYEGMSDVVMDGVTLIPAPFNVNFVPRTISQLH